MLLQPGYGFVAVHRRKYCNFRGLLPRFSNLAAFSAVCRVWRTHVAAAPSLTDAYLFSGSLGSSARTSAGAVARSKPTCAAQALSPSGR